MEGGGGWKGGGGVGWRDEVLAETFAVQFGAYGGRTVLAGQGLLPDGSLSVDVDFPFSRDGGVRWTMTKTEILDGIQLIAKSPMLSGPVFAACWSRLAGRSPRWRGQAHNGGLSGRRGGGGGGRRRDDGGGGGEFRQKNNPADVRPVISDPWGGLVIRGRC